MHDDFHTRILSLMLFRASLRDLDGHQVRHEIKIEPSFPKRYTVLPFNSSDVGSRSVSSTGTSTGQTSSRVSYHGTHIADVSFAVMTCKSICGLAQV